MTAGVVAAEVVTAGVETDRQTKSMFNENVPFGAHCRQRVESTDTGLNRNAMELDSLLSYNTYNNIYSLLLCNTYNI